MTSIHNIIASVSSKNITNAGSINFVRCGVDVDSVHGKAIAKAVAMAVSNSEWRSSLSSLDIENGLPIEDSAYGYLLAMLECGVVDADEVLAVIERV